MTKKKHKAVAELLPPGGCKDCTEKTKCVAHAALPNDWIGRARGGVPLTDRERNERRFIATEALKDLNPYRWLDDRTVFTTKKEAYAAESFERLKDIREAGA